MIELDGRLVAIARQYKPISIRGVFYRAESSGLVPKDEASVRLIQRRLLKLRRQGIVPFSWIVDDGRDVHGHTSYGGIVDLADDVARLYRRDYWRNAPSWVQVWVEKRALTGVLSPVVVNQWGLNLYPCVGQPSDTYLYRAGLDIKNQGVETDVYVLSDFDPAGETIYKTLVHGSRAAPGGLSRFTDGIPVRVHRLLLTYEQVQEWKLPTRPAKKTDSRTKRFAKRYGDISVELEAIPPDNMRWLVNSAIEKHMPLRELEVLKAAEADERNFVRRGIQDMAETWSLFTEGDHS